LTAVCSTGKMKPRKTSGKKTYSMGNCLETEILALISCPLKVPIWTKGVKNESIVFSLHENRKKWPWRETLPAIFRRCLYGSSINAWVKPRVL
jgi:hypothetical protein